MADKQVLKTIESLEMLPKLQKGNVVRKEGGKLIYLNRAVETWIDSKDFMPDETKVVDIEELLDLDNGILLQSLSEQMENNHHNMLSDLAATATSSTIRDNNDDEDNYDDDDDDDYGSPRNCVLYGKGNCLYRTALIRTTSHHSGFRKKNSVSDKSSKLFGCKTGCTREFDKRVSERNSHRPWNTI